MTGCDTVYVRVCLPAATISTVLCDVPDKVRLILDCISGREHSVKTLIVIEPFDGDLVAKGKKCGIEILSLKEMEVCAKLKAGWWTGSCGAG